MADTNNSEKSKSTMIIAGAIILAGLLIGAGIFLAGNNDTDPGNDSDPVDNGEVTVESLAVSAGADADEFNECQSSDEFNGVIDEELQSGAEAGVRGTPGSFLVTQNGWEFPVYGALPSQALNQFIDTILNGLENDLTYDEVAAEIYPIGSGENAQTAPEGLDAIELPEVSEEDYLRGSADAQVILVEYSDLECPFCQSFHSNVQQTMESYDESELAWVYRHFPLETIHPRARELAHASECVGSLEGEEAFWTFVDEVFANSDELF